MESGHAGTIVIVLPLRTGLLLGSLTNALVGISHDVPKIIHKGNGGIHW